MLHGTFTLARLAIGDRVLPLVHGDVVVVARAESSQLDWEIIAKTVEVEPVAQRTHDLQIRAITGADELGTLEMADLTGSAFLVRAIEDSLVFRGTGHLAGFDIGNLRG